MRLILIWLTLMGIGYELSKIGETLAKIALLLGGKP
jgi:hypothetical protein